MDSFACAILFAYIRSTAPLPSLAQPPFSEVYIPITNIPSADIRLRPDFLALLPHIGIEESNVITLDNLPLSNLRESLRPEHTKWILVDHNALQGQLGEVYSSRLAGVIDHHAEEHAVPQDTSPEPRIIEKAGSCASLVTAYCRAAWDVATAQAKDHRGSTENAIPPSSSAQAAKLALAAVLMDTTNLTSAAKVTEHDTQAVEYLEAKIAAAHEESYDRHAFHETLHKAKQRVDDLSLHDILRKDYKQWTERGRKKLGFSVVVKSIPWLMEKASKEQDQGSTAGDGKAALLAAVRDFAKSRELDMCAVMAAFTSTEGEFQRQLFLWTWDSDCVKAAETFAEKARSGLGLERWEGGALDVSDNSGEWRRCWRQRDAGKSRKSVSPLIRDAMSGNQAML